MKRFKRLIKKKMPILKSAVPISRIVELLEESIFGYMFREEKWQRLFTRVFMRNDVPLMTSCSPGLQKKEKNCWSLVRYTLMILGKFRLKKY